MPGGIDPSRPLELPGHLTLMRPLCVSSNAVGAMFVENVQIREVGFTETGLEPPKKPVGDEPVSQMG